MTGTAGNEQPAQEADRAPVDRARVDRIRAALADDRYPIDPDAIAGKLIAHGLEDGGETV